MMYNSTPYSTTGKTPSELFFRRQFRDKIPSSSDAHHSILDGEMVDRDQIQKEVGKKYEDRKRKATEDIDINIGDKVYSKNLIKTTKVTPNFDSASHTVVDRTGGDAIIRDDSTGKEFRRNVVHLKKVEGQWQIAKEKSAEN